MGSFRWKRIERTLEWKQKMDYGEHQYDFEEEKNLEASKNIQYLLFV